MEPSRDLYQEWLWNQSPPETDAHRSRSRNYVEAREHDSATAFVEGRLWFGRREFKRALTTSRHKASKELIESSRRRIQESRRLVVEAKNTLAFARAARKLVN